MLLDQAQHSPQLPFSYDLRARRVGFVNAAYESLLPGHRAQVNEELPAVLARLPPDELSALRHYWQQWQGGEGPATAYSWPCSPP